MAGLRITQRFDKIAIYGWTRPNIFLEKDYEFRGLRKK